MLCQERMNSLETVCNTLSSQFISYSEFDKKKDDILQFYAMNNDKKNHDFLNTSLKSKLFDENNTVENVINSAHSDFFYFRKEFDNLKNRLIIIFV